MHKTSKNPTMRGLAVLALAAALGTAPAAAGEHRLGGGLHYFQTVDDIELDDLGAIEDEGNSLVASYQYLPGGLLRFEIDLEYYEDGYGGSLDEAWAPQVYALLGRVLYGGVGIGVTQSDSFLSGDDWSEPWYAAKVGLDLLLLPRFHLDIHANYRANAFDELDEAESDAITLGVIGRFTF